MSKSKGIVRGTKSNRIMRAVVMSAPVVAVAVFAGKAVASPYASNIVVSGTTVTFTTNQDADQLTYIDNNGAPVSIATTTKGTHTFSLANAGDTFSISALKQSDAGYSQLTGGTIGPDLNGLSVTANLGGFNLLSSDTNPLDIYNSPRGVSVSLNPNAPNFGTAYISNSAAGGSRTGRGLYSVLPDQSTHYGNVASDTAAAGNAVFTTGASSSAPYRIAVGADGSVYVTGWADSLSGVWNMPADLSTINQVFNGTTGPTALPAGQNHGSVAGIAVTGSAAANNLTLYTVDEDLTTNHVTGSGSTTDINSVWKYALQRRTHSDQRHADEV